MAAYAAPAAPALLPAWPVGVPASLKDVAVEMSLESVDALINRQEALAEAIAQQSTDAVLTLVYALRRREHGWHATQATRVASASPSGRRVGDGARVAGAGLPVEPVGLPPAQ
eukprot:3821651-Alexandrium_andersonii.AAC.1